MREVRGVRIVAVDYELLRRDFPHLASLPDEGVDRWLLDELSFIADGQTGSNTANTPIQLGKRTRSGFRPASYGRALVLPVEGGLLDVKGAGAVAPLRGVYETGLASTGEAIREFIWEKAVNRVLAHAGARVTTVGTYAVLDYGFDVFQEDGSRLPAGVVVRQAHTRMPRGGHLEGNGAAELEAVLRRYGITSAGQHYQKSPDDFANLQGTRDGKAIYDFGAFLSVDRFHKPMRDFHDREMRIPTGKNYVQPDPEVRIPLDFWGSSETKIQDSRFDNPWVYSHRLAQDFRKGKATRHHVEEHVQNALGPLEERLLSHPSPASCADLYGKLLTGRF
ncbi:MAG: hypothetical protein HUU37_02015 [Bdellovibrionales bacterium]|nr:hypothetical protein [Bdellovibrionales bacterium]